LGPTPTTTIPDSSSKKKKEVCFQAPSPRPSPFIRKRKSSFQLIFSPYRKTYTGEYEGFFIDVPNEILELIFFFFDSDRDLLSVGCVSKRWNFYANSTSLWQSLYLLHWDTPDIHLKSSKNWKHLFMKKNSEFLMSQISLNRSYGYARRKNVVRTDHLITDLPRETWRPEKRSLNHNDHGHQKKSLINRKKKKRQEIKDEIIEDFLEERKQFFDSFCATSLATTPMKHELVGRR